MKKFIAGMVLGTGLSGGAAVLLAQNERALHPRIARAIEALREAREELTAAPHNFGGHKADAIRATDDAIRQLDFALRYRGREDRR